MELSLTQRARAVSRVLLLCLAASLVAACLKLIYARFSGSLAFFADGVHSLFDSGSTILGLSSVLISSQPPDAGHPYGHRKFETLAALALAMLLLLAGWEVLAAAYSRFTANSPPPLYSPWGWAILALTMGVNLGVANYEAKAARRLKSHFLESDSLHNRSDFLITLGVFASVAASRFSLPNFDLTISVAISLYLIYLSLRIVQRNIKPLVDHAVLESKQVEEIVTSVEGVIDCHNVRSRGEAWHHFLDLNIHLSGKMTLTKAHEITHKVEEKLKDAFPGLVDVVIHTEPHDHPPCSKG